MLSEELRNLAAQLGGMRTTPPADMARALRTAEEVAKDLAEDAAAMERLTVPFAARLRVSYGTALPDGVVNFDALRRLRTGGAL